MNELFCKRREQHRVRLDNITLEAKPATNMLQKISKLKREIGKKTVI